MKKKKIIILHSTAGMGHKKAGLALLKAFQDCPDDLELEIIDALEYTNKIYKFFYLNFYVFLMLRAKWLWGIGYYFTNIPVVDIITRKFRTFLDYRGVAKLGLKLIKESPDAIIATHFFLSSISTILKRNKNFCSKTAVVMTDYGPHSFWLSNDIDKFFVGSLPASKELAKRGIPVRKINDTGIPVDAAFSKDFNKGRIHKQYGLEEEKRTILLMSGGFGVGPLSDILRSLNYCSADIQVIVVCGHNKQVYNNVRSLQEELNYTAILFGFTDKVAELMSVSDIMISKAGGISVTESLNARLPLILIASIPGQETWNEKFLIGNNAAVKAKNTKEIPALVDKILFSSVVYENLKKGIDRIRKPDAAKEIVDIVLREMIDSE